MVERNRKQQNDREELEGSLQIDRDNLDDCLVEQPGHFFHVAEQVAASNARRDTAKLVLEETMAEEDGKFRALCARNEEKTTEGGIQNYLRTLPRIQELQREALAARAEAEGWSALKEAYQQRSFMLRELVALHLSQVHSLGNEHGVGSARRRLGDANQERAEAERRARREGK